MPILSRREARRPIDGDQEALCLHPVTSAAVVGAVPALRALAPLVRGHHERWDGGGYPDGLAGERIPLGARILAVAAAYDTWTVTADEPPEAPLNATEALAAVRRGAGSAFDPAVVEALAGLFSGQAQAARPEATPGAA